jgi:hypothetical protein
MGLDAPWSLSNVTFVAIVDFFSLVCCLLAGEDLHSDDFCFSLFYILAVGGCLSTSNLWGRSSPSDPMLPPASPLILLRLELRTMLTMACYLGVPTS